MICISIVSHGHGPMVVNLANQLLNCTSVSRLIITLNIPEELPVILDDRLQLIHNISPKGFAANHNSAFKYCKEDYFCVVNPDVVMLDDPFFKMLQVFFENESIGLVAPSVLNSAGMIGDNMRIALTPWSLFKRIFGLERLAYKTSEGNKIFSPDWVAGVFMLFRSSIFYNLDGFDDRYFMYCEDVDICSRLTGAKYKIVACPFIFIQHDARRASHDTFSHFMWHLKSLFRYFFIRTLKIFD